MAVERLVETQQLCYRAAKDLLRQADRLSVLTEGPPASGVRALPRLNPAASATPEMVAAEPLVYDFSGDPPLARHTCSRTAPELGLAGRTEAGSLMAASWTAVRAIPAPVPDHQHLNSTVILPAQLAPLPLVGDFERPDEVKPLAAFAPVAMERDGSAEPHQIEPRPTAWLPLAERTQQPMAGLVASPRVAAMRAIPVDARRMWSGDVSAAAIPAGAIELPQYERSRVALAGIGVLSSTLFELRIPDAAAWTAAAALWREPQPAATSLAVARPKGVQARRRAPVVRWEAGLAKLHAGAGIEPAATWKLKAADWYAPAGPSASTGCRPMEPRAESGREPGFAGRVTVPLAAASPESVNASGHAVPAQFQGRHAMPAVVLSGDNLMPAMPCVVEPTVEEPAMAAPAEGPAGLETPTRPQRSRFALSSLREMHPALRVAAILLPVLCYIALRPAPPAEAASAPEAAPFKQFVNARLSAVKTAIRNRAGIEMVDDFRSGLDNWESKGGAAEWSYDHTGFIRPGSLALYRPSMGLTNYDFEFLGGIDKKAISWVYRAVDGENYHAAKLVTVKAGPLPTLGLVRYSVINGKETARTQAVLPLNVHTDTIYRVRMEVKGSDFSLYIQNQLVQFWADRRFPRGGIGFFSSRGESSRIRWAQVSHQYDTIGRLCAYFAPMAVVTYNMQPAMGAPTQ